NLWTALQAAHNILSPAAGRQAPFHSFRCPSDLPLLRSAFHTPEIHSPVSPKHYPVYIHFFLLLSTLLFLLSCQQMSNTDNFHLPYQGMRGTARSLYPPHNPP